MPHWISVQRSPHAFSTNDFKLLVLLVTLLGSIYDKCSMTISTITGIKKKKNETMKLIKKKSFPCNEIRTTRRTQIIEFISFFARYVWRDYLRVMLIQKIRGVYVVGFPLFQTQTYVIANLAVQPLQKRECSWRVD